MWRDSAPRIEFEKPRTTFFLEAKLSTLKIRSSPKIGEIMDGHEGGAGAVGAAAREQVDALSTVPGGKALGTVTRLVPPDRPAPFLPPPTQPTLYLKLSNVGKAKLATLKTANIQVKATVKLIDGETQLVVAKATLAR